MRKWGNKNQAVINERVLTKGPENNDHSIFTSMNSNIIWKIDVIIYINVL